MAPACAGFLALFRSGGTLSTLAAANGIASMCEGKMTTDTVMVLLRENVGFNPAQVTNYLTGWGVACYISGRYLVARVIKLTGPRRFTDFAMTTNAAANILLGLVPRPWAVWTHVGARRYHSLPAKPFPSGSDLLLPLRKLLRKPDEFFWLRAVLLTPGINNLSSVAIKSQAAAHAIANGMGKGEFSAAMASLRALAFVLAPSFWGLVYSACVRAGRPPGYALVAAGLVGAVVPALLHRSIGAAKWAPPKR